MKNVIFSLLILLTSFGLYAQNCVADQSITKPGIYPSYLDTGTVGLSYEHTLQIRAVKDTMVDFMGNTITATVDSVVLKDILGLPASFSYSCEPPRCVFTYQSTGCAKLVGNPSNAEIGEHPLEIIVTSYARYLSFKLPVTDTIRDFTLVIEDSSVSSISDIANSRFSISPNPVHGNVLKVNLKHNANKVLIYNQYGQLTMSTNLSNTSQFSLDISSLSSGAYYLLVFTDQGIQRQKFTRIE